MLKLCLSLSPVSMQWWVWSGSGMGIGRGSQTPPTATPSSPPSIPSSQTSCTSDCTRSVWLQIAFQDVLITFQDVLIIYLSGPSEMSCIKSMLKYTKFSRILAEVFYPLMCSLLECLHPPQATSLDNPPETTPTPVDFDLLKHFATEAEVRFVRFQTYTNWHNRSFCTGFSRLSTSRKTLSGGERLGGGKMATLWKYIRRQLS